MIPRHELKIETFRATGNGGQNVNKVETAVRITHLPTGLQAMSQDQRYQAQNKKIAMETLEKRLKAHKAALKLEKLNELRRAFTGRVRTYDFTTNTVIDHRTKVKSKKLKEVLDGKLELMYS